MNLHPSELFEVIPLAEHAWIICGIETGGALGHLRTIATGFELVATDGGAVGTYAAMEDALWALRDELWPQLVKPLPRAAGAQQTDSFWRVATAGSTRRATPRRATISKRSRR